MLWNRRIVKIASSGKTRMILQNTKSKSHMNCQINHEGKMEVDAIIEMFAYSENLHDVKYAFYVGDRDSKGIIDSELYDDIV